LWGMAGERLLTFPSKGTSLGYKTITLQYQAKKSGICHNCEAII